MLTGTTLTGTLLNALGILVGGMIGLTLTRQFTQATQIALRGLMGVFTVIIGLMITVNSFHGTPAQVFTQLGILILALTLGRIAGRLMHIQRGLNKLGQHASKRFAAAKRDDPNRLNEGFIICALLFCAGPLGPIGAVEDGLMGYWEPLAIKAVMDGLAAMGFVAVYGWGVVLSAIPVLAYQGTVTLLVHRFVPLLTEHGLLDSVNAAAGMLVFCVSLIILELKKLQLGDYLPSMVMAPLLTWFLRNKFNF